MPLIIVSPSIDHRELPEAPPDQITPLEVRFDAHRGRFSSKATLPDKQKPSSSTNHASLFVNTNKGNNANRGSGYTRTTDTTVTQEKPKDHFLSDTSLVVVLSCKNRILTLYFRRTLGSAVVASARPGAQIRTERVELDEHGSEKTQQCATVEDACALETKIRGRLPSPVGPQLSGSKPHTTQYIVERDDARGRGRGFVSTPGAHVHEIDNTGVQSSHSDTTHVQPCKEDDVLTDVDVVSRAIPRVSR